MKIGFVTSNPGKAREMDELARKAGHTVEQRRIDYPEIQTDTLEAVVRFGLDWLWNEAGGPLVIDDSGLFVDSLDGFPGVYSHDALAKLGNRGILKMMGGVQERGARFVCVLGFLDLGGEISIFEGECRGAIAMEARGEQGFGFDPIFVPEGEERTFAQMSTEEKNRHSHRGKAVEQFIEWLGSK